MAEETPTVSINNNAPSPDHDLLIRIDEQLRSFLGVQKDHTTKLEDHGKQIADHERRLGHTITPKGLITGVVSAIGGSLAFMQFIDFISSRVH